MMLYFKHSLTAISLFLSLFMLSSTANAISLTSNAVPVAASAYPPGTAIVALGSVQTYTALANPGYVFDYWSGCDSVSGNNLEKCTVHMNSNKSVTAYFIRNGSRTPLSANAIPVAASWWRPGTTLPLTGSTVTYSAIATPGWTFLSWAGCDSINGDRCTNIMNANKNVTATFRVAAKVAPPELTPSTPATTPSITVDKSRAGASNNQVKPNTAITKQEIQALHSGLPSNNAAVGGDSVSMANGHYSLAIKDISIKSNGLPLQFVRYYSSIHLIGQSNLGEGWTHSFDIRIVHQINTTVDLRRPDGSLVRFSEISNIGGIRTFNPTVPGIYDSLTQNSLGYFTLTKKDKTVYSFSETGLLNAITDAKGNALQITNDTINQRPTRITDSRSGRWLRLSYDTAGYLNTISDNAGRTVNYGHNPAGQLVSVTDTMGKTSYYFYDGFSQLYNTIDPLNQNIVDNQYYSNAQVAIQKDGMGLSTKFTFNPAGQSINIATEKDRMGNTWTYQHDAKGFLTKQTDPLGNTMFFTYNARGNRTSTTDPLGRKSTMTYDTRGNILTKTNPALETFTYTYDINNNLLSVTNPKGAIKSFTYDANNNLLSKSDFRGNKTFFTYSASGQILTSTDANNNQTSYAYAPNGDLSQVTDALGNITTFIYDAYGYIQTATDPVEAGNPVGFIWHKTHDAAGRLLTETDPLGNVTTYTYDSNGNLTSVKDPKGDTTQYTYDANYRRKTTTDALNKITTTNYDLEDRNTGYTAPLGRISTLIFDAAGRQTGITDAFQNSITSSLDKVGQVTSTSYPLNNRTTNFLYDNAGRVTNINDVLAVSNAKTYDVNGQVKTETAPLSRTTTYIRDADGRITTTTDAMGFSTAQTFDTVGNLITSTDAKGNLTSFAYDALNRQISETDALSNVIHTSYNNRGLVKTHTNARGQVITYGYDNAGRLVTEIYPTYTLTHTLDNNGNRTKTTSSLGPVINRTFDALNRLTSRTDQWGNTIGYAYDAIGNLTTLTYPGGNSVTYTYDKLNRLKKVTDWAGRITSYTYDIVGNLKTATLPNGASVTYTYDALNRLTRKTDTSAGVTIADYNYSLDTAGQQTNVSVTEPLAAQLLPVNHGSFNYDAVNRLTARGADNFAYDADSNMTSRTVGGITKTLTWDVLNQLTNYGGDSYRYDADGYRVGSTINGVIRRYVQDVNGSLSRMLVEQDGAGATVVSYIYGMGLAYRVDAASNIQVYHFDSRGSTVALTDTNAAITDTFAYDPFGKLTNRTVTMQQPFTYNGRDGVMDDGNGLYFMRTRYFDAELMRLISKDVVIGFVKRTQSKNRFAFTAGNPISRTDPIGTDWIDSTQTSLDFLGFTPGVGFIFDAVNAGIELGNGNYGMFAFNIMAAVPIAGDAAKAAKIAKVSANTLFKTDIKAYRAFKSEFESVASRPNYINQVGIGFDAKRRGKLSNPENVDKSIEIMNKYGVSSVSHSTTNHDSLKAMKSFERGQITFTKNIDQNFFRPTNIHSSTLTIRDGGFEKRTNYYGSMTLTNYEGTTQRSFSDY